MVKEAGASYRIAQVAMNTAAHYNSLSRFEEESRQNRSRAIAGAVNEAYRSYLGGQRLGLERERAQLLSAESKQRQQLVGLQIDKAQREKEFAESPAGELMKSLSLQAQLLDHDLKQENVFEAAAKRRKAEFESQQAGLLSGAIRPDGSVNTAEAARLQALRYGNAAQQKAFERDIEHAKRAWAMRVIAAEDGEVLQKPQAYGIINTGDNMVDTFEWTGKASTPEIKDQARTFLRNSGADQAKTSGIERTRNITEGTKYYEQAMVAQTETTKFKSMRDFGNGDVLLPDILLSGLSKYKSLSLQYGVSLAAGARAIHAESPDIISAEMLKEIENLQKPGQNALASDVFSRFTDRFSRYKAAHIDQAGARSSSGLNVSIENGKMVVSDRGGANSTGLGRAAQELHQDVFGLFMALEGAFARGYAISHPGKPFPLPRIVDTDMPSAEKASEVKAEQTPTSGSGDVGAQGPKGQQQRDNRFAWASAETQSGWIKRSNEIMEKIEAARLALDSASGEVQRKAAQSVYQSALRERDILRLEMGLDSSEKELRRLFQ